MQNMRNVLNYNWLRKNDLVCISIKKTKKYSI